MTTVPHNRWPEAGALLRFPRAMCWGEESRTLEPTESRLRPIHGNTPRGVLCDLSQSLQVRTKECFGPSSTSSILHRHQPGKARRT